jgi:hypothetical protein
MTQSEIPQPATLDGTTNPTNETNQQTNFLRYRLAGEIQPIDEATFGVTPSEALSPTIHEKGISHLLTGNEARQDQLSRLRTKIEEDQTQNSLTSHAKLERRIREAKLLVKAINNNAGGLPSQSETIVAF